MTSTIYTTQQISTTMSTITFTPTYTSYGYDNSVIVTVRLRNSSGNPISNAKIFLIRLVKSGGTIVYNNAETKISDYSGSATYTIYIDRQPTAGYNYLSSYVPNLFKVEVLAKGPNDNTNTLLTSTDSLTITGKATTVTVQPNKTTYSYGETVTLTIAMYDSYGNNVNRAPVFVRIKRGSSITNLGQVASSLYSIGYSYSISVNTTNFPSAGSYTIEVADNSSYS